MHRSCYFKLSVDAIATLHLCICDFFQNNCICHFSFNCCGSIHLQSLFLKFFFLRTSGKQLLQMSLDLFLPAQFILFCTLFMKFIKNCCVNLPSLFMMQRKKTLCIYSFNMGLCIKILPCFYWAKLHRDVRGFCLLLESRQ